MNRIAIACVTSALLFGSCQSTGSDIEASVERDDVIRGTLLESVRKLEGRWEMIGAPESIIEFSTIANGTAVREVMFPGQEMEMVNMYTLDGNALVMTHYMSDMKITFEDDDHITETWRGTTAGKVDEMPEFKLQRVR
jgi:hypothetical protein